MLARFDMDIRYIPGVTNSAGDALFCYPHVQQSGKDHTSTDGLVEVCLITIAEVNSEIMDTIRAAYPEDRLF